MIAILDAQRAGLLRREHWVPNLIAGTIVGVVALPLAMAFAIASGVSPEQGIYTAILAGVIVSLFGGSRVQIAGPTGAFIVVLSGIVAVHGVAGLQLATLIAGVLLVFMGVLRLGAIIRFIPAPVITGFTAGIGVIIWVGQWDAFFGLPKPEGERFHEKLVNLIRSLPEFDTATTGLAAFGLAILLISPRLPRVQRIPGPLIAMVVVTLVQVIFGFEGVATVGSAFGGIPTGLPSLALPHISMALVLDVLGPAFTIALLGAIESLLSAVVADGMTGNRHDSNQELTGQGVANVACALFGGIAATGAIARTATNIRNGGTSPLAGVTHSGVLVAIVLVLAPLASSVPLAVLAAILFVVAYNMSDAGHFVRMARSAPLADVAILIVTFVLTIFTDLVIAVNVGVLLATLQFLRRMSTSLEVERMTEVDIGDAWRRHSFTSGIADNIPPDVMVYAITGPVFFAAVDAFERALAHTNTDPRALVIRLLRVPFIDITGIHTLKDVIDDLESRGVRVILCEANSRVKTKLLRAGIIGEHRGRYIDSFASALDRADSRTGDHDLD